MTSTVDTNIKTVVTFHNFVMRLHSIPLSKGINQFIDNVQFTFRYHMLTIVIFGLLVTYIYIYFKFDITILLARLARSIILSLHLVSILLGFIWNEGITCQIINNFYHGFRIHLCRLQQ